MVSMSVRGESELPEARDSIENVQVSTPNIWGLSVAVDSVKQGVKHGIRLGLLENDTYCTLSRKFNLHAGFLNIKNQTSNIHLAPVN